MKSRAGSRLSTRVALEEPERRARGRRSPKVGISRFPLSRVGTDPENAVGGWVRAVCAVGLGAAKVGRCNGNFEKALQMEFVRARVESLSSAGERAIPPETGSETLQPGAA